MPDRRSASRSKSASRSHDRRSKRKRSRSRSGSRTRSDRHKRSGSRSNRHDRENTRKEYLDKNRHNRKSRSRTRSRTPRKERERRRSRSRSKSHGRKRDRTPEDEKLMPARARAILARERVEKELGGRGSDRDDRRERDRDGDRDRGRKGYEDEELPYVYSIHRGTVKTIQPFGAFVQLDGYRRHGLVHISQLSSAGRVEKVDDIVKPGDEIWAKVIGLENGKISLSMKDVDQREGEDLNPANEQDEASWHRTGGLNTGFPKLYTIHKGVVKTIKPFGAFVSINGYRANGLVHISQMAQYKVESVEDCVTEGEEVWVKVIADKEGKLSLSMKYVNQTTGDDLDANLAEWTQEESRRRDMPSGAPRKAITLEAVVNATCTRCGTHGHLAADCFGQKGQKFELLAEDASEKTEKIKAHGQAEFPEWSVKESAGEASGKKKKKKKKEADPIKNISEALRIIAEEKARKKKKKAKKKSKKKKEKKAKKKKEKQKKEGEQAESSSEGSGDSSASDSD